MESSVTIQRRVQVFVNELLLKISTEIEKTKLLLVQEASPQWQVNHLRQILLEYEHTFLSYRGLINRGDSKEQGL